MNQLHRENEHLIIGNKNLMKKNEQLQKRNKFLEEDVDDYHNALFDLHKKAAYRKSDMLLNSYIHGNGTYDSRVVSATTSYLP